MSLADLRRVAIRQSLRIRFRLRNGLECMIDEHGVARIPALDSVPDFRLETELASIDEFSLEAPASGKDKPRERRVTRQELAQMSIPAPAAVPDHHDD